MSDLASEVWDGRSVLIKSFWGWSPETWGAIGWSSSGRRDTVCKTLTDPFVFVCNVTLSAPLAEENELGKIVGFCLVSHEKGHRNDFTHPVQHSLEPSKWQYALRAIRAFTYLPEYRLDIRNFDPALLQRAQTMAAHGEEIADSGRIKLLRETPWEEVPVYQPQRGLPGIPSEAPPKGWVRAGPENRGGYAVPAITDSLDRHLYILRLDGPTDALLGMPANGRRIVKIGLAASPELRRMQFQAALPRGAFRWNIHRTTFKSQDRTTWTFAAAVVGEYEMKRYLATYAEHLDGEFYLGEEKHIDEAWRLGVAAAQVFEHAGKTT